MYVIKADGRKEEFSEEKIIQTCMRAGVSAETAKSIAKKVKAAFPAGTTTHKIYSFVLDELDRIGDTGLFTLRESVASLDPTSFEIYVKKVLEAHGYKCAWNKLIQGRYVEHQVDILAFKEKNFIVECKRHFNPHRFTGLGICLQVDARLNDLRLGGNSGKNKYNIDAAWIVTNTKFSEHAKHYAKGTGIRLSGWRYEEEFSLEKLIQSKKVLPVTLLKMDPAQLRTFVQKNIITLDDLMREKPKVPNIKDLLDQSKRLLAKL